MSSSSPLAGELAADSPSPAQSPAPEQTPSSSSSSSHDAQSPPTSKSPTSPNPPSTQPPPISSLSISDDAAPNDLRARQHRPLPPLSTTRSLSDIGPQHASPVTPSTPPSSRSTGPSPTLAGIYAARSQGPALGPRSSSTASGTIGKLPAGMQAKIQAVHNLSPSPEPRPFFVIL